MSLYNMLFGMNPDTDKLMTLLGKSPADFGRFRNCYLEDGYIVVHTRCGGGNREGYEDMFDEISQHPWYSHDQDQDFDCTYADIFFKIPEGIDLSALNQGANPEQQWAALFDALNKK